MIDTDLYEAKKLYPFQEKTVETVLEEFRSNGKKMPSAGVWPEAP